LSDVPAAAAVPVKGEERARGRLVTHLVSFFRAQPVQYTTAVEEHAPAVDYAERRISTGFTPPAQVTRFLNQVAGFRAQSR
jgi:hypothetical protein